MSRDRLSKVLGEKHLSVTDVDKVELDAFLPGYGRARVNWPPMAGMARAMKADTLRMQPTVCC